MSLWRCKCSYIVDNHVWQKYPECPECGQSSPDEDWINLGHDESMKLWEEQKEKEELSWLRLRKLKEVRVPKFRQVDEYGSFDVFNIPILFDPSIREITRETFNQDTDEFYLEDTVIERLHRLSQARDLTLEMKTLTWGEIRDAIIKASRMPLLPKEPDNIHAVVRRVARILKFSGKNKEALIE